MRIWPAERPLRGDRRMSLEPTSHVLATWGLPTFTWVAMWSVLGLSGTVVDYSYLLRTRWSASKPWRRYAVLSLWVHVLLACATMTVRIVTGAHQIRRPRRNHSKCCRYCLTASRSNNPIALETTRAIAGRMGTTHRPTSWLLPNSRPCEASTPPPTIRANARFRRCLESNWRR